MLEWIWLKYIKTAQNSDGKWCIVETEFNTLCTIRTTLNIHLSSNFPFWSLTTAFLVSKLLRTLSKSSRDHLSQHQNFCSKQLQYIHISFANGFVQPPQSIVLNIIQVQILKGSHYFNNFFSNKMASTQLYYFFCKFVYKFKDNFQGHLTLNEEPLDSLPTYWLQYSKSAVLKYPRNTHMSDVSEKSSQNLSKIKLLF